MKPLLPFNWWHAERIKQITSEYGVSELAAEFFLEIASRKFHPRDNTIDSWGSRWASTASRLAKTLAERELIEIIELSPNNK